MPSLLILLLLLAFDAGLAQSHEDERPVRLALFPALAYAPETRGIGGGYLQAIVKQDSLTHDSQLATYAILTQNRQAEAGIIPEIWWRQNRWMLSTELSYQKWPSETYGIGISSREEDETGYTVERMKFEFLLKRALRPGLFAGLYALHVQEAFLEPEAAFPFPDQDGRDTGLGLDLSLDTRGRTVSPDAGALHRLNLARFFSDFPRTRLQLDSRVYHSLWLGVLASQVALESVWGDPGFRQLSELGDYLRAYGDTRFLDRSLAVTRLEYRVPLFWRLGAVAFAEAGTVAERWQDLGSTAWKTSIGLGGRYSMIPGEHLNLRLDLALGEEGATLYLRLGEEF